MNSEDVKTLHTAFMESLGVYKEHKDDEDLQPVLFQHVSSLSVQLLEATGVIIAPPEEEKPKRKNSNTGWTLERRAQQGERLRARQAAKYAKEPVDD